MVQIRQNWIIGSGADEKCEELYRGSRGIILRIARI
jgi:hypothetical protein